MRKFTVEQQDGPFEVAGKMYTPVQEVSPGSCDGCHGDGNMGLCVALPHCGVKRHDDRYVIWVAAQ